MTLIFFSEAPSIGFTYIRDRSANSSTPYAIITEKIFVCYNEQQTFEKQKQGFVKPPVLALPNLVDASVWDTDASNFVILIGLPQLQGADRKSDSLVEFFFLNRGDIALLVRSFVFHIAL